MSVSTISNVVQDVLQRGAQGLFVEGDNTFNRTLTVGQIVKAKIMRHYEGGRYLADFSGQHKVVDSAIPLRVGEMLHGRVLALGDRVHLQRIVPEVGGNVANQQVKPSVSKHAIDSPEQRLNTLFQRYQGQLSAQDRTTLLRVITRSAQPDLMALSGLVLSKLGVRITPVFLHAVYRVLAADRAVPSDIALSSRQQLLAEQQADHQDSAVTIKQLASLLDGERHIERQHYHAISAEQDSDIDDVNQDATITERESGSNTTEDDTSRDPRHAQWYLGQWLLNAQSQGSVSHRFTTIPLWFGERLVEVNVALFSQRKDSVQANGTRYRSIVLSLDTERLGHIEVTAKLANRRLHLTIATTYAASTQTLSRYLGDLKSTLAAFGWYADELEYVTTSSDSAGRVIRSVVEHYVSQDSLSRLM